MPIIDWAKTNGQRHLGVIGQNDMLIAVEKDGAGWRVSILPQYLPHMTLDEARVKAEEWLKRAGLTEISPIDK